MSIIDWITHPAAIVTGIGGLIIFAIKESFKGKQQRELESHKAAVAVQQATNLRVADVKFKQIETLMRRHTGLAVDIATVCSDTLSANEYAEKFHRLQKRLKALKKAFQLAQSDLDEQTELALIGFQATALTVFSRRDQRAGPLDIQEYDKMFTYARAAEEGLMMNLRASGRT